MDLARIARAAAGLGVAAIVLAIASAPVALRAADHLDAPGLTSPGGRPDADINDVFVFPAADPSRTAIAVTTHPAAGVIAPLDYATDVRYLIKIDRDGDAVEDLTYAFDFGAAAGGSQAYTVTRYTGSNARTLTQGVVLGQGMRGAAAALKGDARAFAGLRSDPFFFDLGAFLGAVVGVGNGRTFCDANTNDFFSALNTNAVVLEIPNEALSDTPGGRIAVWALTVGPSGQIDRMGRPAINAVFNKGAAKNAFNAGSPATDRAGFEDAFIHRLQALSSLSGTPYDDATARAIVEILLPDVLTYQTGTTAAGPLNGRAPADDVIDVELGLVTRGAVPSDCVGPHSDYLSAFPYLGEPHR